MILNYIFLIFILIMLRKHALVCPKLFQTNEQPIVSNITIFIGLQYFRMSIFRLWTLLPTKKLLASNTKKRPGQYLGEDIIKYVIETFCTCLPFLKKRFGLAKLEKTKLASWFPSKSPRCFHPIFWHYPYVKAF